MKFILFFLMVTIGFFAQSNKNFINKNDLLFTVKLLSSKEFGGRLSGSEGYDKASEFARQIFKTNSLKDILHTNFYQHLNIEYNEILKPNVLNCYSRDGKDEFKLGADYVYRGFTGSADFKKQTAFVGYGISQPEIGYDDYTDVNVKDKIVIAFKYNPKWKHPNGDWKDGSPRNKAKMAFEHGAKGIFFVSTPNDKKPQQTIGSILDGEGVQMNDFPSLHISIDAANKFLVESEYNLNYLQTIIDSTKKPFSLELKTEAEIFVKNKYEKEKQTQNIVGLLEGTDEILRNEYVVVGAHLDHVGTQGDIYFPGANDNASGSSVILNMIRAINENRIKTKRSIIFVLFASEELGLFGSKYFVENLPIKKNQIVCMLNFDCVGYGDSIQIGGGKSSPKLWEFIHSVDSESNKMMVTNTWPRGGADAEYFFQNEIPTAYFVTTNSYEHLHQVSDKEETLNPKLFEAVANLGLNALIKIANGEYQRENVIKN